jgi:predicted nucleotidyltransferase
MPTLDLQPRHLEMLLEVLRQHVPDAEIWAYGSRVKHTGHETSDLDLVIRNPAQLDVPLKNLHLLRDALSESNLPIFVEVLDWARIPEGFRREIQLQPVVILPREHASAE